MSNPEQRHHDMRRRQLEEANWWASLTPEQQAEQQVAARARADAVAAERARSSDLAQSRRDEVTSIVQRLAAAGVPGESFPIKRAYGSADEVEQIGWRLPARMRSVSSDGGNREVGTTSSVPEHFAVLTGGTLWKIQTRQARTGETRRFRKGLKWSESPIVADRPCAVEDFDAKYVTDADLAALNALLPQPRSE